jgi:hypothetical protein
MQNTTCQMAIEIGIDEVDLAADISDWMKSIN